MNTMGQVDGRFYVGGSWREGTRAVDIRSPWDGSTVGRSWHAAEKDAEEAIQRALVGFEVTRKLSSQERFEVLSSLAAAIKKQKEEFAELITAEIGKPITYSRVEVERAILTAELAAEEARRIGGEVLSMVPYRRCPWHHPVQFPSQPRGSQTGTSDCQRQRFHPETGSPGTAYGSQTCPHRGAIGLSKRSAQRASVRKRSG
jgi:hypothetical protein